eukprot:10378399-Alexandrium_andersonii.AAC.1
MLSGPGPGSPKAGCCHALGGPIGGWDAPGWQEPRETIAPASVKTAAALNDPLAEIEGRQRPAARGCNLRPAASPN